MTSADTRYAPSVPVTIGLTFEEFEHVTYRSNTKNTAQMRGLDLDVLFGGGCRRCPKPIFNLSDELRSQGASEYGGRISAYSLRRPSSVECQPVGP